MGPPWAGTSLTRAFDQLARGESPAGRRHEPAIRINRSAGGALERRAIASHPSQNGLTVVQTG